MAGHSHWARIKRAKAVTDARRGRLWSKLSRAIIMAARNGDDPDANLALRYAIDAAKAENMPKDTIERAIKKGAGGQNSESYEELAYEGYGPGGAAVIATALTDNRNRTSGELRNIFDRRGGNLGATNSVGWMFSKRGLVVVPAANVSEDRLTEISIEGGADDVQRVGDRYEISCDPSALENLRTALAAAKIATESAELALVPSTTLTLSGEDAARMMQLLEDLEEHDDVQKVYSNFELAESDLQQMR